MVKEGSLFIYEISTSFGRLVINMIDDKIIGLFEQFSHANNLKYYNVSLPYRPFGEVIGVIGKYVLKVYIYQSESRISRSYDTVFTAREYSFLPKGFCIERKVDPYGESKTFYDRVIIRSYDTEIVHKFLDDEKELILKDTFKKIEKIENSLFKVRCLFRVSDEEIILSVGRVFTVLVDFNKVYTSVNDIFTSLIAQLDKE